MALFRRKSRPLSRRPAGRIHLVRHGEVDNPDHIVYGSLPGYHLSELGRQQAADLATRLSEPDITGVLSSPLDRAVETAAAIAAPLAIDFDTDDALTEWKLSDRWAGVRWEDLSERFPGELDAYFATPDTLAFSPESLEELATRMTAAIDRFRSSHPAGDIVVVAHQDPIQAARLVLTGRGFEKFHEGKPAHASVITLISNIASDAASDSEWIEATYWEPDQGAQFPPPPPD